MSASLLTKSDGVTSSTQFAGAMKSALTDGVIFGCDCTALGGGINISSGLIIMSGFMIAVEAETITPAAGNQIVVKINVSEGSASIITRESSTLTQENIFNGGDEYEVELATYTISGSSVSSVIKTLGRASANSNIAIGASEPNSPQKGDIWLVTA